MPRARRDRRVTLALGAAAACGAGLVGVGLAALGLHAGHEPDVATLHGFAGLYRSWLDSEIELTARLADPIPYAAVGLTCIGVALARRRLARAAAVAVVLVGTGLTTQVLKHALAEQRYADWLGFGQVDPASWPSGHATAALTLVLCAVMVAPPAWRVAVALAGAAGTLALAAATLALAWHYPSDVLAGFLVAGLWVSLALVVLQRVETADPETRPPARPRLAADAGHARRGRRRRDRRRGLAGRAAHRGRSPDRRRGRGGDRSARAGPRGHDGHRVVGAVRTRPTRRFTATTASSHRDRGR